MGIAQSLLTAYFAWTLSATGLAKIVNWREAAIGLLQEDVVPRRFVRFTVVGLGCVELVLAGTLPFSSRAADLFVIAALFGCFGSYHLLVARRSRVITCTCSGAPGPREAVTRAALIGTCGACWLLAVVAGALAVTAARLPLFGDLLVVAAFVVPVFVYVVTQARMIASVGLARRLLP